MVDNVTVEASPGSVTMYNVHCDSANTEYSQVLPIGTRHFHFRNRKGHHATGDIRYAFVTGKVAGSTDPFGTLADGSEYGSPNILLDAPLTVYFASTVASISVEIEVWY